MTPTQEQIEAAAREWIRDAMKIDFDLSEFSAIRDAGLADFKAGALWM